MCIFEVTGGTITVIMFYNGNGLHGNYRRKKKNEESPIFLVPNKKKDLVHFRISFSSHKSRLEG